MNEKIFSSYFVLYYLIIIVLGGGGLSYAKKSEKCLCSDHYNIALIKTISLFDTALVIKPKVPIYIKKKKLTNE